MQTSRTSDKARFVEVAVTLPVDQTFTYALPDEITEPVRVGQRVLVPFGSRRITGHVIALPDPQNDPTAKGLDLKKKIKEILAVLDPEPVFGEEMLGFLRWVASYYHCPMGEVLRAATPAGIDLKSMRQVTLTEKGQAELDPRQIDSPRDHVLAVLMEKGSQPAAKLNRLPGVSEGLLKNLERSGLLEIDSQLQKIRVSIRKERILSVNKDLGPEDVQLKGKKQKAIWQVLNHRDEMPLADLEKEIPKSWASVKRLIQFGLVSVLEREEYRDPLADFGLKKESAEKSPAIRLTPDQEEVLGAIVKALKEKKFAAFLLHGVTGSGKTEIYVRAAKEALQDDKDVIILVPEISLTPQMVNRFYAQFGDEIAVMHSALSDGERYDQWRRIIKKEVRIVIGARSAVFAPLANIGLIVVDEEHEPAFKQEKSPFYNARDLAVARGQMNNAVVVLGSATPSVESFQNAKEKKFHLLSLPERVGEHPLPQVEIVDMTKAPLVYRQPQSSETMDSPEQRLPIFSKTLLDTLKECLERQEQAVLFLNRRGYAPFLMCSSCGNVLKCSHCEISLTYYQNRSLLRCHYCEHTEPVCSTCPSCDSDNLVRMGFGTETVEQELAFLFPQTKVVRMDRDTTTRKGSHHQILKQIETGEAQVLIGTQMVAKGLHFPRVTLVGVLCADTALHMPDFRAGERTFQLLSQVAGRAGRGDRPGRVIIQTHSPDHSSLIHARDHDYAAFFENESEERRLLQYPPHCRLVCVRVRSSKEGAGQKAVKLLRGLVRDLCSSREEYEKAIQVLGPAAAPLARLRGEFRWQILLKSSQTRALHRFAFQLRKVIEKDPELRPLRVQFDVDPINMM